MSQMTSHSPSGKFGRQFCGRKKINAHRNAADLVVDSGIDCLVLGIILESLTHEFREVKTKQSVEEPSFLQPVSSPFRV